MYDMRASVPSIGRIFTVLFILDRVEAWFTELLKAAAPPDRRSRGETSTPSLYILPA